MENNNQDESVVERERQLSSMKRVTITLINMNLGITLIMNILFVNIVALIV